MYRYLPMQGSGIYRAAGSIGPPAELPPSLPATRRAGVSPESPRGVSRRLAGPGQRRWAAGLAWAPRRPSVRPYVRAAPGLMAPPAGFAGGRGGPGRLRLKQLISPFLPARSRRRLRLRLPPRTRKCCPARAVPESGTVPPPGLPVGTRRVINGSGLFPGSAAQAGTPPSRALRVCGYFFFPSLPSV